MANEMKDTIQIERIKALNNMSTRNGQYVVYWMQSSQRTEFNHALEYAIQKANELSQPLIVLNQLCATSTTQRRAFLSGARLSSLASCPLPLT